MNWVGILFIHQNRYRYNGRLVAHCNRTFLNYLCFQPLPKMLVIFLKDPTEDTHHIYTDIPVSTIWVYNRHFPFIYVHKQRKQYQYACLYSILISLFCMGVIHYKVDSIQWPLGSVYPIQYDHALSVGQAICKGRACIERVGFFPGFWMIQTPHPISNKTGCHRVNQTIYRCQNK